MTFVVDAPLNPNKQQKEPVLNCFPIFNAVPSTTILVIFITEVFLETVHVVTVIYSADLGWGNTATLAAHRDDYAASILPDVVSFISYNAVQHGKFQLKSISTVYFEPV